MELWKHLIPAKLAPKKGATQSVLLDAVGEDMEVWQNDIYRVIVRRHQQLSPTAPVVTWLSINRHDKAPCNDWRHFQWIKNQLVGAEKEGIQLYPAESRMVDSSNQYHLWVLEADGVGFPVGFTGGRLISEHALEGGKQRSFPKNMKPYDLKEREADARRAMKDYNEKHGSNLK